MAPAQQHWIQFTKYESLEYWRGNFYLTQKVKMPYIKDIFYLGYRMVHFFNHSERNEKKEAMELGCFLHNKAAWILDKKVGLVVVMILPKESESSHSKKILINIYCYQKAHTRANIGLHPEKQCRGSGSKLDPYSGPFWIRICIPNADPNPRR